VFVVYFRSWNIQLAWVKIHKSTNKMWWDGQICYSA